MMDPMEPTEKYDGGITVHVLGDDGERERVRCRSYEDAIETTREEQPSATVVKIEDRDGEIVFTSAEMDIDDWETEWRHARRRLDVEVEQRECPYDNVACFADDLCVQCKMDVMREAV